MEHGRTQFAWPPLTPAVKLLLLINGGVFVASFVLTMALQGSVIVRPFSDYLGVSWNGMFEWWGLGALRVFTYQFAHSYGDPFHILFNMLILYFFGTFVEAEVGRRGLIRLYIIGGVIGAILQVLMQVALGSPGVPAIGASGPCYTILVYAAFMAPRMRVILIVFPIELRWLVGVLVGIGVYMSLLELRGHASSSTAHGGHLGGALWGFLAFKYFRTSHLTADRRPGRLFGAFRRWREQRRHRSELERRETLDRLLEKVHTAGMGALTGAERRFLERASKDFRDD